MACQVVVGIDASAKKPGWAILERGKFVAAGVVRRGKGQSDWEHMHQASRIILKELGCLLLPLMDVTVAVEVQRGPIPAKRRKALEWCMECRGRLLQELSRGDPMYVPASREKKPARRKRIEAKYPDARKPNGQQLPEDAIDALSVADAAWAQLVVRQHAKG